VAYSSERSRELTKVAPKTGGRSIMQERRLYTSTYNTYCILYIYALTHTHTCTYTFTRKCERVCVCVCATMVVRVRKGRPMACCKMSNNVRRYCSALNRCRRRLMGIETFTRHSFVRTYLGIILYKIIIIIITISC